MKYAPTYVLFVVGLLAHFSCAFDPILPLDSCTSDADCASKFPNSYCDFDRKVDCNVGVCMCKTNLVPVPLDEHNNPNNISCLPRASVIGSTCKHDNECVGSFGELSICHKNGTKSTCECTETSVYCERASLKVKECVRPRLNLGEPCSGCSSQCESIAGAVCSSDSATDDPWRCRCGAGYVESENGTSCIPVPSTLGGKCDLLGLRQCRRIQGSICEPVSKTCQCNNATHVPGSSNISCVPKREHLGMNCSWSQQCLPVGSVCQSGVCACGSSLVQSKVNPKLCVAESSYANFCQEDAQCIAGMGPNAKCIGSGITKTCQCKPGHIRYQYDSATWGYCYPRTPLGGQCDPSVRGMCVDGTGSSAYTLCGAVTGIGYICGCASNATEHEGTCYKSTQIEYDPCTSDVQCKLFITGPVLCDYGRNRCVCDDNYRSYSSWYKCELIE